MSTRERFHAGLWLSTIWLCFGIAVGLTGCPHAGPFKWPDVAKCGGSVGDLVGTVTQILLNDVGQGQISPGGQQKLQQLATQYGADTVLCLVDQLFRDWTAPGASVNPERVAASARAQDFLAKTGTRIER